MLGPGSLRFDPPARFAESLGEIATPKEEERIRISQLFFVQKNVVDDQETPSISCKTYFDKDLGIDKDSIVLFHQCCTHFIPSNRFAGFVRRFGEQVLDDFGLVDWCSVWIRNHDFREIICSESKSALGASLAGLEMAVRAVYFCCADKMVEKGMKRQKKLLSDRSPRNE